MAGFVVVCVALGFVVLGVGWFCAIKRRRRRDEWRGGGRGRQGLGGAARGG